MAKLPPNRTYRLWWRLIDLGWSDAKAGREIGCSSVTVNLAKRHKRELGLELGSVFGRALNIPIEALPLTADARKALTAIETRSPAPASVAS